MDGRVLLQLNNDGSLYVYSVAEQRRILSGVSIDGELVLYTDDGFTMGHLMADVTSIAISAVLASIMPSANSPHASIDRN